MSARDDYPSMAADRRVLMAASDVWDRFAEALDRPAQDVPGLEKLMNTPTVLDDLGLLPPVPDAD